MRAIEQISKAVAEYYNLYEKQLHVKSKKGILVKSRQIVMFTARELTKMTFTEIGGYFDRDHATAIHSHKTVKNEMATNQIYRYEVQALLLKCQNLDFAVSCRPCKQTVLNGEKT